MLDVSPVQNNPGVSGIPHNQISIAEVNQRIRTDNEEQLLANHVAGLQEESGAIQAKTANNRENEARVQALLMLRSSLSLAETGREIATEKVEEKRAQQALATAAYQRTLVINSLPQARDSGADSSTPVDVSA